MVKLFFISENQGNISSFGLLATFSRQSTLWLWVTAACYIVTFSVQTSLILLHKTCNISWHINFKQGLFKGSSITYQKRIRKINVRCMFDVLEYIFFMLTILSHISSWSHLLHYGKTWNGKKPICNNVKNYLYANYELPQKLLGNTLSHKSSTMSHLHIRVTQLKTMCIP